MSNKGATGPLHKEKTMDREKNILLAKKYMVESIYRSANIEGIGMTFPETQTICDGMSISGHSIDEINAVNDLKNAWKWIFTNIDKEIDTNFLCQLNRIVGKFTVINAGNLRNIYDEPIRVPLFNGDIYYPPLPPTKEVIDEKIKEIINDGSLDNALELFCFICKGQYFNDGNKRTATLLTNAFMIKNGLGIFSIPVDKKLEFYNGLTMYYSDDSNKDILKNFLKENCLTGYSDK
ncbi:MAG: Fic family protein [Lachnospira sp.]